MHFTTTSKFSTKAIQKATRKLVSLFVGLSVREDNYFVGCGMGGNIKQLCILSCAPHHLSNIVDDIQASNIGMTWNYNWLVSSSMKTIREKINWIFSNNSIPEFYEFWGTMTLDIWNNPGKFPQLIKSIIPDNDSNLFLAQLISAHLVANAIAQGLDNSIEMKSILILGNNLLKFSPEIALLVVRQSIGIERMVKYNLDETPPFSDLLTKINKIVNDYQ